MQPVQTFNPNGKSSVVLVCEHAAFYIPSSMSNLGLSDEDAQSHAAWDPGALNVAQVLSGLLDAPLVAGTVSRLVYDCNRPPSSPAAMPARSEVINVPGNVGLNAVERSERIQEYYEPFRAELAERIRLTKCPIIVTIHSFTPIYFGQARAVEVGILHDTDTRLADAMLDTAENHTPLKVERNQPYGPQSGVTHTLKEHALPAGHLNVMLEIRNDLIRGADDQVEVATMIAKWLTEAFASTGELGLCSA